MSFDDTYSLEAFDLHFVDWSHVPVINIQSETVLDEALHFQFEHNQEKYVITIEPFSGVIEPTNAFSIKIGEDVGKVIFSHSQFHEFIKGIFETADTPENLCTGSMALVIEETYSSFFQAIEEFFEQEIVLDVKRVDCICSFKVSIHFNGKKWIEFCFYAPDKYIEKLKAHPLRIINHAQGNELFDHIISLPVSILSPEILLKTDEFFDLQVNDALTLPINGKDSCFENVFVNGQETWQAKIHNNRYVISAKKKYEIPFQQELKSNRLQEMSTLKDTDVKVHVELCSKRLKISELKKLKIGSTLPFDANLPDQVKLYVGESCFAIGDLMQMDGNIVIRIAEFEV